MKFAASALVLCALSSNSNAFSVNQTPSLTTLSSGGSSTRLQVAQSNEGPPPKKKKGRQQQKKRRFAQDLPETPVVVFQPAPAQTRPKPRQDDEGQSEVGMDSRPRRKSPPALDNSNNMVQSSKSIDELENIMEKRWGVSHDKWSADFSEWEVADEEGNDTDKTKAMRKSVQSGRKVRSKAVFNPWDRLERKADYDKKEKRKQQREDDANTNASAFQDASSRQNSVLDRVRKNQERLQSKDKKPDDKEKTANKLEADFYDEDDEGYEPSPSISFNNGDDEELESDEEDFYSNIISPEPAGGAGSSKSVSKKVESQGGFFFNDVASDEDAPKPTIEFDLSEEEVEKRAKRADKHKKDKAKRASVIQKVDENGNKLFLTLKQAQRNCDEIINMQQEEGEEGVAELSSWEDIGITNPQLLENLSDMDCGSPLSVQDKACPSIVSGNDVLVSTHTGSGKTLAFLAPLAEQLLFDTENNKAGVKVIIVAPGRELASQIVAVARELLKGTGLTTMLAIGGTPFGRNYENIRKKKPEVIVGTPGRIAELVVGQPGDKGGKLKIANLQSIVLDECDALLEYKPHKDPTVATLDVLKRRHGDSLQSILCSATAGDLLGKAVLDDFLRPGYAEAQSDDGDKMITSGEKKTTRVSRTAIHGVVRVDHQRYAIDTLRKVLYTEPAPQQALIFVDNARRVGIVVSKLAELGIIAAPLHGGQGSEKGDRAEVNKALREGFVGLVVATEMAARGLDAPYLTHVINLDLPTDASHYAHRAGRCGRGGRPGVVVNIAVGSREKNVPKKFAEALDIDMHLTEAQAGQLKIMEEKNDEEI
mmetsp:Transcript_18259/g.26884  ORF Transcript_18259/g.26884 Transcript_18259/m.26884 type:complete len:821 (-) Transcript_18259:3348-5810(-)